MDKWFLVILIWMTGLIVVAHPMPHTMVSLSILEESVLGTAKVPQGELEFIFGHSFDSREEDKVREYFSNHIRAVSGEQIWEVIIGEIEFLTFKDPWAGKYHELVVHFELRPPVQDELRHFDFYYDALVHQLVNHEVSVLLDYDWTKGVEKDQPAQSLGTIKHIDGKVPPLKIRLESVSGWKVIGSMIGLGMSHIREGLDHILFLLTILIIAPLTMVDRGWSGYQGLGYTVKRFLKISLAFTIGHSISLLAGSFNWIPFRAQYIEVLVAITIMVSSFNCIKPIFKKREVLLGAGFGLIHGLAFSITLSHLDLSTTTKMLTLLGFNIGIELMQLVIMLLFFPILLMSKWKIFSYLRIGFAVVTIIISIGWVIERIQ